ncbi:MAG TPA: hypothetical protein VK826_17640 [Bacteroidia bacterium]|nr:hypothetical protein [Bacteroidia bacterium]
MRQFQLILLFSCLPFFSWGQNSVDTFSVNYVPLVVKAPEGWRMEQINDDVCNDSTWNYIARNIIDTRELNGRIGIRILENGTQGAETKSDGKLLSYETKYHQFGKREGYLLDFTPSKIKGCRSCGKQYSTLFITPLSDKKTLYIYFSGNGNPKIMADFRTQFMSFCDSFFVQNAKNLDHFLLLNEYVSPAIIDTTFLGLSPVKYFYNSDFNPAIEAAISESVRTITLTQTNSFIYNATITVVFELRNGYDLNPNGIYTEIKPAYSHPAPIRYTPETIRYDWRTSWFEEYSYTINRVILSSPAFTLSATFTLSVKVEDALFKSYYQLVLEQYADNIKDLNALFVPVSKAPRINIPENLTPQKSNQEEPIKFKKTMPPPKSPQDQACLPKENRNRFLSRSHDTLN